MSRLMKLVFLLTVITLPCTALATEKKLKVVASFSIIADFARNVGGDRVDITTLIGPDGDVHVYAPSPAAAAAVASADVILVNGLQFEGFLQRLIEASNTRAPVVELTRGGEILESTEEEHHHDDEIREGEKEHEHAAEKVKEEEHRHSHGEFNPHAWQSIHNAEIYVENIATAFCAADAAGCDIYKANAGAYGGKLEELEKEIKTIIAEIPQDRRTVIVSHDAFGYFEHEYGIKFLAPEGISTQAEASAANVATLIDRIRKDKAVAIFVENITNPRMIKQIAAETGIKVGGTLYSDALSDESGPASTYIDMMRHNANTIKAAILGS